MLLFWPIQEVLVAALLIDCACAAPAKPTKTMHNNMIIDNMLTALILDPAFSSTRITETA
jgi:hypothetical protein